MSSQARISPLDPPYEPDVATALEKWMRPGSPVPPLALFRTIARHPMLRARMLPLGNGLLGHGVLAPRVRELLILRTCARCDARYEWGVHVTVFAASAGLDDETIRATAMSTPEAITLRGDDDALVIRIADEFHQSATLSDSLFDRAAERFGEVALLEMATVVGFYHLISFMIRTAGVESEPWAAPFPEPEG